MVQPATTLGSAQPHRRQNILTGEWVLVSPHRMLRPWQGDTISPMVSSASDHDPGCYLCPGNVRANGELNPAYSGPFVFPNDFAALLELPNDALSSEPVFQCEAARGEARVICYSPDHSATMARLNRDALADVINCWCELSRDLGARWSHVQIFENKGAMMGASSPHPHGQVWASDFVPYTPDREDIRQRDWLNRQGHDLLGEVIEAELRSGERIVEANPYWLCFVPYWAAWPFETMLVARESARRLEDLSQDARSALALILQKLLARYDALFGCDFPYSMGWHGAPHCLGSDSEHWRLHAHFFPPLLRSASVRKHMVGFELLAETQRDLTPEAAADRLRAAGPA